MRYSSLILLGLFCSSGFAEEDSNFSGSLEAGVQSDSNVVVDEVEEGSDEDSNNRQFKFALNYKKALKDAGQWSASYRYNNKIYLSADGFDTELHIGSLGYSQKFDKVKLGVNVNYADASLDNKAFLKLKHVTPNLSWFINKTRMLNASWQYGTKDFADRPERSATQNTLSLSVSELFNGVNHYISVGGKLRHESADTAHHGYDQWSVRISHHYRTRLWDKPLKSVVSYRYQDREYELEHPQVGALREDERQQLQARFTLDWTDSFYNELTLTRNSHQSNLTAADYDQHKVGLMFGYQW